MKYFFFVLSFFLAEVSHSQYVYISSYRNEIYRFDLSGTCSSTFFSQCAAANAEITDIAVDASGGLYICRNDSIFFLDNNNPAAGCSFITSFGSYNVKSIEIGPDRKLYAVDKDLLRYDFTTGQLANLGGLPQSISAAGDLVFYVNRLYMSTVTGSIYEIDINAPGRSQFYYNPKISNLKGLVVAPARCFNGTSDELRLFAFENSGNNRSIIHMIDVENKITYYNYCTTNLTITGNSGFHPPTVVTGQPGSVSLIITPATCNKTADGRIAINMNTIPIDTGSYSFSLNNGTENSIGIFNNLNSGNYLLSIKNKLGCSTDTMVTVPSLANDCNDSLFVPTAFTPNADGNNDIFKARSFVTYTNFQMLLFDRNGRKVFQSNSMFNGWDGTIKGVLQNTNIYVWQIKYRNLNGQTVYRKGHIALIR